MVNVEHVTEVLLADGWHSVVLGTFDVERYEYRGSAHEYPEGYLDLPTSPSSERVVGRANRAGGPMVAPETRVTLPTSSRMDDGFEFEEETAAGAVSVSGPLSSVLAVRELLPYGPVIDEHGPLHP